ncbi:MAG TPA: leucyl aminopeptidase [Bacteroidia bacterium]|nr:leucyl aminopeptidase [Bacteroidia bacterium]
MTTLKKAGAVRPNDNLIILCNQRTDLKALGLSVAETEYVHTEFEQGRTLVSLNQFNRYVFLQLLDSKKTPELQAEACRKTGSSLADRCNEFKLKEVVIADTENKPLLALALAEGMALANYQFIAYKSTPAKEEHKLQSISINSRKLKDKDLELMNICIDAVCRTRNLVNEPANKLNATQLASAFEKMGKESGFGVEILKEAKIRALQMGGLLAVNKGSVDAPTFTVMEYKPARAKNKKPFVLVGKGVTYDTGGLSLKPTPNSMDMMKCDMAGGAVVGAVMYAIAKAKLPVHVIGLVPATDNRPGGNAFAPGDIITMMSGQTVEMLNSDAEGRMILADALHYAKRYNPELVCEFSTLTGAAAAAIGGAGVVVMGNAPDRFKVRMRKSGHAVHERLAELPFWEEYDEMLKSDIADMKNIGGSTAGAITAGRFLNKFTDYPYLHFDIAGPAFLQARDAYRIKGGTGVGVRLLFDFFRNL